LFGTFLNGFDESLFDDDLSICVNGIYSDADCSRIDANGDVRLFVPLAQQKSAYPIVSSIPLEHDTINLPCGPDDVVIVK
jgi:hypothetical protein